MVSQELLAELKVIMREDYGIDLKQDVLTEFGNMLFAFFELLAKEQQKEGNGKNEKAKY